MRSLTRSERERVTLRIRELREQVAGEALEQARVRAAAKGAVLPFSLFFFVVALYNLLAGSQIAGLVALAGATAFAAIAFAVGRAFEHSIQERNEVELLNATLLRDAVRVIDIVADAAIVLHEPGDDASVVGYVLGLGDSAVVYVKSNTCSLIDPSCLPSRNLRVEWAEPMGVIGAQAHGQLTNPSRRRALTSESQLKPHIWTDLVVWPASIEQLARDLAKGAKEEGTNRTR